MPFLSNNNNNELPIWKKIIINFIRKRITLKIYIQIHIESNKIKIVDIFQV